MTISPATKPTISIPKLTIAAVSNVIPPAVTVVVTVAGVVAGAVVAGAPETAIVYQDEMLFVSSFSPYMVQPAGCWTPCGIAIGPPSKTATEK